MALAGRLPGGQPRDALDELVDEAAAEWRPTMQPLVTPLLEELDRAIAAGESMQTFAARLPGLVREMDAGPLGERIARAAFMGRLVGEADLQIADEPVDGGASGG